MWLEVHVQFVKLKIQLNEPYKYLKWKKLKDFFLPDCVKKRAEEIAQEAMIKQHRKPERKD